MAQLTVRVPASTSNLGHGFDCMGMAVALYNRLRVDAIADDRVELADRDVPELRRLVERIRADCAAHWGRDLPGLRLHLDAEVPLSRGLGSSATLYLGVAAACQRLAGLGCERSELIRLGVGWEGHPDNIVAAALGGFTVAAEVDGVLRWQRVAVPEELRAVVAIPAREVVTREARRVLPDALTRTEAVRAWQRCCLITAALANRDLDALAGVTDQAWHERHRAALNPGLAEARVAATAAGAIACFLSGSGSTVLAWSRSERCPAVAAALAQSYRNLGVPCETRELAFDNEGLVLT